MVLLVRRLEIFFFVRLVLVRIFIVCFLVIVGVKSCILV